MLQSSDTNFLHLMFLYISIIWETETYPSEWTLSLLQPVYKGGGQDRLSPASYRSIYLLTTITKLLEGIIQARLTPFTEIHNTLTHVQKGSRPTRQIHDAIYALIAIIQHRAEKCLTSYCCFIDYTTVYLSVHRERLIMILKDNYISGKMWNLLRENSKRVRIRVLHSLIPASSQEPIGRVLPEGSRLSPTLFGIFAAELMTD